MTKKKKQSLGRRDLLKGMSSGIIAGNSLSNPMSLLWQTLAASIAGDAYGLETSAKRYVHIQDYGAPPRWVFDLFIDPYNTSNFSVDNPYMATRYVDIGGRYEGLSYKTIDSGKGIRVPWMWQFPVPAAGSGTRDLRDLLDHMLSIQGINVGIPGHGGAAELHLSPLGATTTLTALSPDNSASSLIPSVDVETHFYKFRSQKSYSHVSMIASGTNPLLDLLDPFIGKTSPSFDTKKSSISSAITAAESAMEDFLKADHPDGKSIEVSRAKAKNLLQSGFGDLSAEWGERFGKYADLVERALLPGSMSGLTDKPIGKVSGRTAEYRMVYPGVNINSPSNLINMITTDTTISRMAAHFAIAEFVIEKNLSRSITISPGSFINLTANGNNNVTHKKDEHGTGRMISLYLNTMYFRAFGACLLEFISHLKNKDIFDDTVIDVAGEFNRNPNKNGFGSNHGYTGKSVCLFNCNITKPRVIGNIETSSDTDFPGFWGQGGKVVSSTPDLNNKKLGMGHLAATIATMLETPSPVTSAVSLVSLDPGTGDTIPKIDKAKIV